MADIPLVDVKAQYERLIPQIQERITGVLDSGVFEAPLKRYTVLTAIGSALWAFAFAGAGWALGSNWESFHHGFRFADYAVAAGIVALGAYILVRRRRSITMARRAADSAR